MLRPEPQLFFLVTSIFNIISILLCTYLFYKAALVSSTNLDWKGTILICFALIGIASRFFYQQCRPDCLGNIFFLTILIIMTLRLSEKLQILICGVLLGMLGATYPTPTVILFFGLSLYHSTQASSLKAIKIILFLCCISIITFISVIHFISPFSFIETINGLSKHSLLFKERFFMHPDFLYYYFTSPSVSFQGLILLLFIISLAFLYKKYLHKIKAHRLFLVLLFFLFIYLYFSVLWDPGASYNVLFFSPLFFAIIIFLFHKIVKLTLLKMIILFCFLLTGISYFRYVVLFPWYIQCGITLVEARYIFKSLEQSYEKKIHTDKIKYLLRGSALWVLSEDYNNSLCLQTRSHSAFS